MTPRTRPCLPGGDELPAGGSRYVGRGGDKLAHALAAFGVDVAGLTCIDFGSHVGGFVDCLLQHGAARVHAVEPGYGVLHERLRRDPRVVIHERSNVLRFRAAEPCDLATLDVGWTPLRLALPGVGRNLKPGGRAIALVKPQYEAERHELQAGVVPVEALAGVLNRVRTDFTELGWRILAETDSPLLGQGGNREFLWLLRVE